MDQSGQGGLPVRGGAGADPTVASVAWAALWAARSPAWPVGPL